MYNSVWMVAIYLIVLIVATIIIFARKGSYSVKDSDISYDMFKIENNFPEIDETLGYAKKYKIETVYEVD